MLACPGSVSRCCCGILRPGQGVRGAPVAIARDHARLEMFGTHSELQFRFRKKNGLLALLEPLPVALHGGSGAICRGSGARTRLQQWGCGLQQFVGERQFGERFGELEIQQLRIGRATGAPLGVPKRPNSKKNQKNIKKWTPKWVPEFT